MKHSQLVLPLILTTLMAVSCTKTGDDPLGPNPVIDIGSIDVNRMTDLRPSMLVEPMIWGGTYVDPLMDSIIPGKVVWDSTNFAGIDTIPTYCQDKANWYSYVNFVPLYQDKDVFISRIKSYEDEVELLNPGKLMVFKTWKFVTDVNRGVHIYDDKDPKNPKKVAFINVPGVLDIALKNQTLYVNAYSALVALDIADPENAKVTEFIPQAFPPVYSTGGVLMDSLGNVAVAWRADTTYRCYEYRMYPNYEVNYLVTDGAIKGNMSSMTAGSSSSTAALGKNGSMSRFAISSDWLYAVDNSALRLFKISVDAKPEAGPILETGKWDLETIFRDGSALFIGSMTGMSIYDHSKGGTPVFASTYSHITSCDPVVVQEGIAYVTLRSGNRCANGKNELNILDVKDIYHPTLLSVLPMKNPAGLAVEDSTLFVCEGSEGLAVIDVKNPSEPSLLSQVTTVEPEDVVIDQGILTLIGPSGIWRMDAADRTNLLLLSYTESEATVQPTPYDGPVQIQMD